MGQNEPEGETLLLMHIPKTAGTSLRWIAEQQYAPGTVQCLYPGHGPEIDAMVAAARHRMPTVVMGHFRYGLHERLPCGGRYATFFRDPVDQVVSLFNHLRTVDDPANDGVLRPGAGLDELLRHGWARNLQTQFVTGLTPEQIEDDPDGSVQLAKEILNRHFLWFGVVERFAQSLRDLAALLSWRVGRIPRLNRASDRASPINRTDLSFGMVKAVADVNACDIRLHSHACRVSGSVITAWPREGQAPAERHLICRPASPVSQ